MKCRKYSVVFIITHGFDPYNNEGKFTMMYFNK